MRKAHVDCFHFQCVQEILLSLPVCAGDCHMNLTMQNVSRGQHFMAGDIYVWQAVLATPH